MKIYIVAGANQGNVCFGPYVTHLYLSLVFKATDLQAWVRLLVFASDIYRCLDRTISFILFSNLWEESCKFCRTLSKKILSDFYCRRNIKSAPFPDNTNLNFQKWLQATPSPTVKCRATIVIMTTGIISLVLLVLMAIVMYFVMKIYSVLRAIALNLHTFNDTGMEDTGRKMWQTRRIHGKQQTPIWSVENTGRVPEEHDERKIQVSQLTFVKDNVVVRFWMPKLRHYLLNIILIREEPILGLFASFCFKWLQRWDKETAFTGSHYILSWNIFDFQRAVWRSKFSMQQFFRSSCFFGSGNNIQTRTRRVVSSRWLSPGAQNFFWAFWCKKSSSSKIKRKDVSIEIAEAINVLRSFRSFTETTQHDGIKNTIPQQSKSSSAFRWTSSHDR